MARDVAVSVVNSGELRIEGVCSVTHKKYSVDVPHANWKQWKEGRPIHEALPQLSVEQREFLITHRTPYELKGFLK